MAAPPIRTCLLVLALLPLAGCSDEVDGKISFHGEGGGGHQGGGTCLESAMQLVITLKGERGSLQVAVVADEATPPIDDVRSFTPTAVETTYKQPYDSGTGGVEWTYYVTRSSDWKGRYTVEMQCPEDG